MNDECGMNDEFAEGRLIGVESGGDSIGDSLGAFTDTETAAMNMALDQAILESVDRTSVPCLRFYRWQEPTLSLGYFQKLEDRQTHLQSKSLPCVRRASGGGAIVHHHELTYSIAVPDDHLCLTSKPTKSTNRPKIRASIGANAQLYTLVHGAIARAVRECGILATSHRSLQSSNAKKRESSVSEPVLCFQRRTSEDLIVAGYKVLGSAQRRGKRSLLQHGSLLLRSSPYAPQLPGLINLGAKIGADMGLVGRISLELKNALNTRWMPSPVDASERQRGSEIASAKFLSTNWTHRR